MLPNFVVLFLNHFIAILDEVKLENVALKNQLNELVEEKESYDRQIEEFTEEVNKRVDEWKVAIRIECKN